MKCERRKQKQTYASIDGRTQMSLEERQELRLMLQKWYEGVIDAARLQELAEKMIGDRDCDETSREEDQSIEQGVLLLLDSLPALGIIVDDVPELLKVLVTPSGQAEEGWNQWDTYWEQIDPATRRQAIQDEPVYFL